MPPCFTAAGVTTDLTYDPLGRLWQVVKGPANTRFLYDGDELAAEYDANAAITRRFMFAGMDEPIPKMRAVRSGVDQRARHAIFSS